MKTVLIATSFVLAVSCLPAQGLLNRIKNKANQELNNLENQAANKNKNQSNNPGQNPNSNANPNGSTTAPQADPVSIKAYNNYDFVPGDKILFEDNFMDDQDGEFPAKWDLLNGQGVVNKIKNEPAFFLTEGNYVIVTPRLSTPSYLTDPFTIELDYFVNAQVHNGVIIFLKCTDDERRELEFSEDGNVSTAYFTVGLDGTYPGKEDFSGQWHHVAVVFKKGQIKCYVDQYRVLVMPNTQIVPVSVQIGGVSSNENPIIFKNVKIAAGGGMNMIGKKFTDTKIITHGINFEYNKSTIRPESMGTLNMVKKVMTDNPELKFEIGGHTDSDGDAAYNLKLSQDRAEAVKKALTDLGVDAARFTTKGYGATKPISDNNTPEGKANNRRVEFVKL